MMPLLALHGFVLAGGKSTRMGRDKALLEFEGRPMIEIAVETLRGVCAEVSIAGNRDDLAKWAGVVYEGRIGEGPAAGIEAALGAAVQDWVLMLPVDLPRMSGKLLRRWAVEVMARKDLRVSYMECAGEWHPALCMVQRECLQVFREELDAGNRKLKRIFERQGDRLLVVDAGELVEGAAGCFVNMNTPEDLVEAEMKERQNERKGR